MPYPKNKSENYANLGGLNQKVSRYIVGESEFLNLKNLDAQTPGALSSVFGTTQNLLSSITGIITGIADFYKSSPTFGYAGETYNLVATTQFNAGNITGQTFSSFYSFIFPGNINQFSFIQSDSLFGANSYDFFKYPSASLVIAFSNTFGFTYVVSVGSGLNFNSSFQYSLPKPLWGGLGAIGGSGDATGLTGTIILSAAFVRADAFVGPASFLTLSAYGQSFIRLFGPTLSQVNGLSLGFTNFGIIGTRVWMDYIYSGNGEFPFQNGPAGSSGALVGPFKDILVTSFGTSFILISQGASEAFLQDPNSGAIGQDGGFISAVPDGPEDYQGTFLYGPGNDSGSYPFVPVSQPTNPSTIEQFNNFLFMAGFQDAPDTFWWSLAGEFEKRDPENFDDFNANDGDIITCLKAYFSQLIIFKVNSIGAFSGGSSDTFQLVNITNQYGCLSPQGAAVFQQRMFFLDKKGICEYNGANTAIVSNKLESYFARMNVNAARNVASMVHVKQQNQVQCSIPIDGATACNLIVFYDYLTNFWGTRPITNTTALSITTQGVNRAVERYGSASGMVYSFGQSLSTDNGQAFTCLAQSRFITGDGLNSEEKMFRRLYLDATIPSGSTYNFAVNFYQNQGLTPVLSTTMVLSDWQNRLEFGISGEDLSVEFIYSEGNFLKINGFTIEYRFQRQVGGKAV